jgi:hypothetical protein
MKNNIKILLIGDYSGVHYELSEELKKRKINVTLLSSGDGYKGFKSDLSIKNLRKFMNYENYFDIVIPLGPNDNECILNKDCDDII